jgi:hypothetical protein
MLFGAVEVGLGGGDTLKANKRNLKHLHSASFFCRYILLFQFFNPLSLLAEDVA